MGLRETLALKETLEAATPGPWEVHFEAGDVRPDVVSEHPDDPGDVVAEAFEVRTARLIALAPELAQLALDMGELLRVRLDLGFVPGRLGDPEAISLLARLDQLGKEQT